MSTDPLQPSAPAEEARQRYEQAQRKLDDLMAAHAPAEEIQEQLREVRRLQREWHALI